MHGQFRETIGLRSRSRNMRDMERPFTVAFSFGVGWIVLSYLGDFVVLPVWNNLNIGVCFLAIVLCVAVYFTEYLAIFPISYRWTCVVLHTDLVLRVLKSELGCLLTPGCIIVFTPSYIQSNLGAVFSVVTQRFEHRCVTTRKSPRG